MTELTPLQAALLLALLLSGCALVALVLGLGESEPEDGRVVGPGGRRIA
jgi:hypothetical protein